VNSLDFWKMVNTWVKEEFSEQLVLGEFGEHLKTPNKSQRFKKK